MKMSKRILIFTLVLTMVLAFGAITAQAVTTSYLKSSGTQLNKNGYRPAQNSKTTKSGGSSKCALSTKNGTFYIKNSNSQGNGGAIYVKLTCGWDLFQPYYLSNNISVSVPYQNSQATAYNKDVWLTCKAATASEMDAKISWTP